MLKILHKLGRTDGAEIAEAALVLPLVFMFLLGIIWFGRAFNIYSTMSQAAQRAAATAARPACATCVQACQWLDGGGNDTGFPCDNTVEGSVYAVTDASNLDRAQIAPHSLPTPPVFCPAPAPPGSCSSSLTRITICRSVELNNPSTPVQCGVIVSFEYPFQMYLPFTSLNLTRITLTAQAQSRMEN
jgi:hypothetical protein